MEDEAEILKCLHSHFCYFSLIQRPLRESASIGKSAVLTLSSHLERLSKPYEKKYTIES